MLKITNLTKHYKGTEKGITDVSLTVEPGDLYALIGANGAGKTTLLKCVCLAHDFEAGSIEIGGVNLKAQPLKAKRMLAYIPDNPEIYDYLTGWQFLNFVMDIYGVDGETRKARIKLYADAFEITDALTSLISSYSHGMKQKLLLISAFAHDPKLLILDEPFVGLDPKASVTLKRLMGEMCERGGAILYSTHVLDVAEKLCNRVSIIKAGSIAASGKMEALTGEKSLEALFMEVAAND